MSIPALPDNPELKYFAAPLVSDFNADGLIDLLVPVCREQSCAHVDRFLVWSLAFGKWEQFQLDMKVSNAPTSTTCQDLSFFVEPESTVVFRAGEFSLDGYPDLIATIVNGGNRTPLILENVHSDNGNFSR